MQDVSLVIGKTSSGKYKVYVWGQPDWHLMDWRGCNYRYKCVEGQPHYGFETAEGAEQFARKKFKTNNDVKEYGNGCGDGTFLTEEKFSSMEIKDVTLPEKEKAEGVKK